jgi:hypothetical protein
MKQFATSLILQLFLVLILSMVPTAHAFPQAIEPWVKETGKLVLIKDGKSEMPIVVLLLGIVAIVESEERHHKCDARKVKTPGALSQFAFSPPALSLSNRGWRGAMSMRMCPMGVESQPKSVASFGEGAPISSSLSSA